MPTRGPMMRDRRHLCESQYADDAKLALRIHTHARYTEPSVSFPDWVLDLAGPLAGRCVVDVGCGSGLYVPAATARGAHYVGVDFSEGMLRTHTDASGRLVGDAAALPLRNASSDVLLMNHMLYHVPDIDVCLAEARRVLRPGGCVIAATNSLRSMEEIKLLPDRALLRLGHTPPQGDPLAVEQFATETGNAPLARHFESVTLHELDASLVFSDPQPVLDYIDSTADVLATSLPTGVAWPDVFATIGDLVAEDIAEHGAFRSPKRTCAFVAR